MSGRERPVAGAEAALDAALARWARGGPGEAAGDAAALARIRAHGAALAAAPVPASPSPRWWRRGAVAGLAALAAAGLVALLLPAPAPVSAPPAAGEPGASFELLYTSSEEEEMLL